MTLLHETGVIHGRFQVLHNDHLTYLLAGKELCRHLVVGITNPCPALTRDEVEDSMRSAAISNPLSYYERSRMVADALAEVGVDRADFSVVPLPINMPEQYHYFVPMDATFYLTVYDDWGRKKLNYFQGLGIQIHVLWERALKDKGISSTDVRTRMAEGREWRSMVPGATARLMDRWHIDSRLAKLHVAS
ncbi:nicotinate-nucleotide adenylyltransferase [uncultured Pseudodesulfovibrio sp.]|uniref:nicotinate-nucleotide adenylyltransferase n=1 Tax=uncultured Pseudodesulfovibrio sp. TaxID=2035858 RepID=UPI0029C953D8|nr:nicotinate-nucleotide adenylyltransferase [uncultured Pseudodesulfovibrio sp.]